MLEVTSTAQEVALGVDFADIYKNSELYRSDQLRFGKTKTYTSGHARNSHASVFVKILTLSGQ